MEKEIQKIIIRILSGEACLEDKQKLIVWLGQDEENIRAFGHTESIWNALEIISSGKEYNSDEAFERFKEIARTRNTVRRRNGSLKIVDWVIRIAAIVVIVTGLSYLILRSDRSDKINSTSVCEIVAPRGSKARVILPDGTRVWLNADSKINYRKDFNEKSRDIYLEGEGYFEVAKNQDKPFVVATADIRIRALGTIFNVKSYPGENIVETTLIEGKVVLEKDSKEKKVVNLLTLKPNQKVTYYKNAETMTESAISDEAATPQTVPYVNSVKTLVVLNQKVNSDLAIAWKNNRLYFENESFESLSVKLERRFGVTIHFMAEDIKQYHFSGKFDDIIIEQVLAALQFASPFYYAFRDKDIYISNKPVKVIPGKGQQIAK